MLFHSRDLKRVNSSESAEIDDAVRSAGTHDFPIEPPLVFRRYPDFIAEIAGISDANFQVVGSNTSIAGRIKINRKADSFTTEPTEDTEGIIE